MPDTLRSKLVRLAHSRPDLRPHLLPILADARTAAVTKSKLEKMSEKAIRALANKTYDDALRSDSHFEKLMDSATAIYNRGNEDRAIDLARDYLLDRLGDDFENLSEAKQEFFYDEFWVILDGAFS